MHLNVQSLRKKRNHIIRLLEKESPTVLVLTEHWLEDFQLENFVIKDYTLVNSYARKLARGGGVLILVKDNVMDYNVIKNIDTLSMESVLELCTINVKIKGESLNIVGIYRPPHQATEKLAVEVLQNMLLVPNMTGNTILVGDFNVNFNNKSKIANDFVNVFKAHNFRYLLTEVTRRNRRVNAKNDSCLDNILINFYPDCMKISNCDSSISDHHYQALTFDLRLRNDKPRPLKMESRIINSTTLMHLQIHLNRETWEDVLISTDPDTAYDNLLTTIKYAMDVVMPKKQRTLKGKKKKLVNWTKETDLYENRIAFLQHVNNDEDDKWKKLKNCKRQLNRAYIKSVREFYSNVIAESKDVQKETWKVIKSLKQQEAPMRKALQIRHDDQYVKDTNVLSEMFNDYYLSVPERVTEKIGFEEFDESQLYRNVQSIYLNQCSPQEMSKIISKLSSKKSAGYDEISNQIIKACKSQIIVPLLHICNLSMQTGIFPKALKRTIIQPHYKKKERDKLENYRPIALIPCISKVLEKVIFQRINDFFIRKGILAPEQFGYSIGRGTADANIHLVHQILNAKMKKKKVIAIFLDLSKAFDCVNHKILLNILYKYGIRRQAYKLIQSYLSERTQVVELTYVKNGKQQKARSQEKPVKFSVPQGSVLGPFLFIVYVNCLKNCIEEAGGKAIMYVDDTNIIVEGDDLHEIKTVTIRILLAVQKLFTSLNLSLNWDKTMYAIFNDNPENFELSINNVQLTRVWNTSFLGVTISSDLKWNCQGEILISRLNKALFIISQMIQSLYKKNSVQVYFAFFHSMIL